MNLNLLEAIEVLKSDDNSLRVVMEYYGVEFKGNQCKCPFHNDKSPSMSIKGDKYKCFTLSCSVAGDLIDFIKHKEGLNLLDATKKAIEILNKDITIEKDKLDNLKEYIEKNNQTYYNDENFKLDGIYFYKNRNSDPVLVRIKYKNFETGKKKFSQANIIDKGEYYGLDFKGEKANLIYNMPRVIKGIEQNKNIFLVEGEKDADNLNRLGFVATTCREIHSVTDEELIPLYGSNLIILGDNDEQGEKHIMNIRKRLLNKVKSFKRLKFNEIYGLGNKADISDFMELQIEKGLSYKEIRNLISDKINRTLDECNKYELQQDFNGIYKTWFKPVGEDIEEVKIYLTNFNVERLSRIENIDTDEEVIELEIYSNLGERKTIKGRSNKIFLDPKSFNGFMNMGFVFDGKPKDLNMLKIWINKYFLIDKKNEYLITGIREIDNKKMLITPKGSLMPNGKIDKNYKADNDITRIDFLGKERLSKEKAIEISKHILKFNSTKNCINILGSLVSHMFNGIYRYADGINTHVLSYVGESGSGKSFTLDYITRPLLNLDSDTLVFSAITKHGLLRCMNDTYLPVIIDEVKPSQAGESRKQILSNTIRNVTGGHEVIKGTKDQSFKKYKHNASLIIAGEEMLDETAAKNRCNIVWFSCNDMSEQTIRSGNYFLSKEGRKALNSLGMEIYLYIMNNFNTDKLLRVLNNIERSFAEGEKVHPRIQATFNNTMLGYIVLKHVLISLGANESDLESDKSASELIYQNLRENVLDGEYATKQIYDEILEAIDELASGANQYSIAEDYNYKQDNIYIKLDLKTIFPILESYYRSRGKQLSIGYKAFTKMLTKSKYVEGKSNDYYKTVNLQGKNKKCYFIKKEKLKHLDMPNLIPLNTEWEEI